MNRSRLAVVGAVLAVGALVAVPVAASGHTDNLYSFGYTPVDGASRPPHGITVVSKTDASATFLPQALDVTVGGLDICAEQGYATAYRNSNDENEGWVVALWDHDSGALTSTPALVTVDDSLVPGNDGDDYQVRTVTDIDTTADCALYGIVFLTNLTDPLGSVAVVASIDATTGEAIPLGLDPLATPGTGLATDPVTGTTYLFTTVDGALAAAVVDLTTGAVGASVVMTGVPEASGDAGPQGAVFDDAGTLWLVSRFLGLGPDLYQLMSFSAGADYGTAAPVSSAALAWQTAPGVVPFIPLAVDSPPAPELAATGTETSVGVVLAAGILLLAGTGLVIARRRTG